MNDNQTKILEDVVKRTCDKNNLDYQTIDTQAMIDNSLTYQENKAMVLDYVHSLLGHNSENIKLEREKLAEQQEEVVMQALKAMPTAQPQELYKPLYQAVEKFVKGYSAFLLVKGKGATGKSYNIKNALNRLEADYVVVRDTTTAYLPQLLYEHNGKIIWFQDCAYKFLRGVDSIEILKSITETNPEDRIVNNYNYNPEKKDIPKQFIFSGRVLMDFNRLVDLKYLENYQALISRADIVELVFSKEETASLMRDIAKTPEQKEVTEFIIENYNEIGIQLFNLRVQANAFNDYKFCKENGYDWKEYILEKLKMNRSPIFSLLYQFLGKGARKTTELKKWLIASQNMTVRMSERRIKEWIEIQELYNLEPLRERDFLVSLFPPECIGINCLNDTIHLPTKGESL